MKRLIFALFVAAITTSAAAHDHNRPDLEQWFQKLHGGEGGTGNWCCNGGEAAAVKDPDWDSKDGNFRVRVDGEWYPVSDNALIRSPNLDGPALVWMNEGYSGKSVRCFIPGTMG